MMNGCVFVGECCMQMCQFDIKRGCVNGLWLPQSSDRLSTVLYGELEKTACDSFW
jgi:hypothetical protein